jgi:hypothetical protein
MRYCIDKIVALVLLVGMSSTAIAEPLAAPGDMQFRTDLQLLADSGVIDIPLTTWPVSLGDVHRVLANVNETDLNAATRDALARVRFRVSWELDYNAFDFVFGASAAAEPRVIRTFEDTPRAEGEGYLRLAWLGERLAFNLTGRYVSDPIDGDEFRPDDTYLGMALGNWMLTAGWQDRWYGPGWDGSLILSNNARPTPGVMLQRINSLPFESKWFRWIGPWSFTSFMGWLDDERPRSHGAMVRGGSSLRFIHLCGPAHRQRQPRTKRGCRRRAWQSARRSGPALGLAGRYPDCSLFSMGWRGRGSRQPDHRQLAPAGGCRTLGIDRDRRLSPARRIRGHRRQRWRIRIR